MAQLNGIGAIRGGPGRTTGPGDRRLRARAWAFRAVPGIGLEAVSPLQPLGQADARIMEEVPREPAGLAHAFDGATRQKLRGVTDLDGRYMDGQRRTRR